MRYTDNLASVASLNGLRFVVSWPPADNEVTKQSFFVDFLVGTSEKGTFDSNAVINSEGFGDMSSTQNTQYLY